MSRIGLLVPLTCLMACAMLVSGSDAAVVRRVARVSSDAENLLVEDAWHSTDLAAEGFTREGDAFVCDNGDDAEARRGVNQTVTLNQDSPRPIAAEAWSKAEGVGGTTNAGYSLYLDIIFTDGTPSWGNKASFSVGTHDWERRQVTFLPPKPIKEVRFFLLLRGHAGKAWFRAPVLHELAAPEGSHYFDGVPVISTAPHEGFSVRDVAAGSDYHSFDDGGCAALDLELDAEVTARDSCQEVTATLRDTPAATAPSAWSTRCRSAATVGSGSTTRAPRATWRRARSGSTPSGLRQSRGGTCRSTRSRRWARTSRGSPSGWT